MVIYLGWVLSLRLWITNRLIHIWVSWCQLHTWRLSEARPTIVQRIRPQVYTSWFNLNFMSLGTHFGQHQIASLSWLRWDYGPNGSKVLPQINSFNNAIVSTTSQLAIKTSTCGHVVRVCSFWGYASPTGTQPTVQSYSHPMVLKTTSWNDYAIDGQQHRGIPNNFYFIGCQKLLKGDAFDNGWAF